MIPILYSASETDFNTNGLGALSDVSECKVTEERNGSYELEMQYPVKGRHYSDIVLDAIIYARPSDGKDPQPFQIYKISTPINDIVTISAYYTVLENNATTKAGIYIGGTELKSVVSITLPEVGVRTRFSQKYTISKDGIYRPVFTLNSSKNTN